MTEELVMGLGADAVRVTLFLAGPILVVTMVVGLMISVFQAVTQINEATLTFIPKVIAVIAVMAVMAPWMLRTLQEYAVSIFGQLGQYVH